MEAFLPSLPQKTSQTRSYDILEYLAGGMTEAKVLEDFSELTLQDIKAFLSFASEREKRLFVDSESESILVLG